MEIIVQGKGTEYYTPDEVILNINFSTKGKTYEEALKKEQTMCNYLQITYYSKMVLKKKI